MAATLVACVEPASKLEATVCGDETRCHSWFTIRLTSRDLLQRAPRLWRFHEDFAQGLSDPSCTRAASGDAGFLLKWRRPLIPALAPEYYPAQRQSHYQDSVAISGNRIAINAGATLWLLDADTGLPTNMFIGADGILISRALNDQYNPYFESSVPVVAFAGDGGLLWTAGILTPLLLDLGAIDVVKGPLVVLSWEADHPFRQGQTTGPGWWDATAAVGSDGTLFWRNYGSHIRALEPSGNVRWEAFNSGGWPILDGDRIYWQSEPIGLRQSDGGVVWTAQTPAGQRWPSGFITDARTGPLGSVIPVLRPGIRTLSAHRRDGTMIWAVDAGYYNDGINSDYFSTAEDSSGTLYAARVERVVGGGGEIGAVEGRNAFANGDFKWRLLPTRPDGGSVFPDVPVASQRGEGIYFTGSDCLLYAVDKNGVIRGTLPLGAPAMGVNPHLVDGVLYVLTSLPMAPILANDGALYPDGDAHDIIERYGCPLAHGSLCPPINGAAERVLFLNAIQVE